jgi:hypothetical protein
VILEIVTAVTVKSTVLLVCDAIHEYKIYPYIGKGRPGFVAVGVAIVVVGRREVTRVSKWKARVQKFRAPCHRGD